MDLLPDEDIVYIGDTANGPYGPLTIPEIRKHALAIGDDLAERGGVKAIVIACNTASAACLRDARERYAPIPVIEVVLPRGASCGGRHQERPDRCARHRGDDRLTRIRGFVRRRP